jgi:hypothetical protein
MLTTCLKEHNNQCIPIDISSCEKCSSFELDPLTCTNYKTTLCLIKKEKCPCKNWEANPD